MLHKLAWLIVACLLTQAVFAEDGLVAYRSSTGMDGLSSPKIKYWDSAGAGSFAGEVELGSAGSPVNWLVIKSSPSYKWVLVTLSADGFLDAYVCTLSCELAGSWTVTNDIGFVGTGVVGTRAFDVDFETSTGDALIIYAVESTSTTCDLAYKILPDADSSVTGAEICIDDSTEAGDVQYSWVAMDRNPMPASEEMIALAFDETSSDINAWVWGGTSWASQLELTAAATATSGFEALAVEYASDGSIGMIVGGDSGFGIPGYVVTSYWDGGAWIDSADFDSAPADIIDTAYWITLKSLPASADLQAVIVDSGDDLHTSFWTAGAWSVTSDIDTSLDTSMTRPADFAANPSTVDGKLAWDTDAAGTTVSEMSCAPECTGPPSAVSTYAGTGAWIALFTNPTTADAVDILGFRLNSDFDIGSFYYDSTSWTNYGDSAITADTTVTTFEAFSFDFGDVGPSSTVDLLMPKNTINCEAEIYQDFDDVTFYTCGDTPSINGNIVCDAGAPGGNGSSSTNPTNASTCDLNQSNGAFYLINNGTNATLNAMVLNFTIGDMDFSNISLDNYIFDSITSPGCNGTSCNNCPGPDTMGCFKDIDNSTATPNNVTECDNFVTDGELCECFSIHIDNEDAVHKLKNAANISFVIKKTLETPASDPCP